MEITSMVSLVATVAFGLLSVVFYFRARRHKRLTFIFDQSELHTKTHPNIRITFGQRDVENLSRLRAVCWNSGTEEIRSEDIPGGDSSAVLFSDATVLSVAHVGSSQDTGFVAEPLDEHSVSVRFAFLNPGDCGLFEVLYEADRLKTPTVTFHARVIGGRRTDSRLFSGPLTPAESVAAFVLPLACLLATYLSAGYIRRSVVPVPDGFKIGLGAVGLVLLLIGGAAGSAVVAWKYARRVHESRLPGSAREFFSVNGRVDR